MRHPVMFIATLVLAALIVGVEIYALASLK